MSWEVFTSRVMGPRLVISRTGMARLTIEAQELLGKPPALQVMYDATRHRVGFRKAERGVRGAYKPSETGTFSLRAFLKHYDIEGAVGSHRVALEGDILVADLHPSPAKGQS